MKAWIVQESLEYSRSTIVFAETRGKAKAIALHTDTCEDCEFTEVYAIRAPKLDDAYHGNIEMDWFDDNDRIRMVRDAGFYCSYEFDNADLECKECPAREWCERWERINE